MDLCAELAKPERPGISAVGKYRLEEQEFKVTLNYTLSSRPA